MMRQIRAWMVLFVILLLLSGCGSEQASTPAATPANLPTIQAVSLDREELPRYEALEMVVELTAEYENSYDARQVRLDGLFTAPDGSEMRVPGFWDSQENWRLRFTPSQVGEWRYQLVVNDANGPSQPNEGSFQVTDSQRHGWLQVGSWVDPDYSSRYLVHHDGTPFYGVGHCDALNILDAGFNAETGVRLFDDMRAAGENYVVWWPLYSHSPISARYDDYNSANLSVIDLIVRDAQEKGIFLVFTIWDHPQLRGMEHAWGAGNWQANNGFRHLTSVEEFFTDAEAWAWQENFYRYIIARWGYSPAIGLWQTVSEINGTNAYGNTNRWHEKVNNYFVENDPYRHPTTASMSGDVDWPEGHAVMDVPQVHLYEFENDAVASAEVLADWTALMWRTGKPNWVGEFGVPGNTYYPELFHNALWAALANGAALTPAEWNSGGSWMQMTPEMYAVAGRLAEFMLDLPLVAWDPVVLKVTSLDEGVRGWGVAGEQGGLIWVQDYSLPGEDMQALRADESVRSGVTLQVENLPAGDYQVSPYDTWQGMYLESFDLACAAGQACLLDLPDFHADLALKITALP